jgi:hypothetical protein
VSFDLHSMSPAAERTTAAAATREEIFTPAIDARRPVMICRHVNISGAAHAPTPQALLLW